MIECVTWATEHRFPGQPITQQFELRFQNSILMEEWTRIHVSQNEVTGNYEETDQYDNRHTEYLIKRDEGGRILGSIRIGPTTLPYMLKDHFAATVGPPYELPCSPQDHELSRLAVDRKRLNREECNTVANELLLASQKRGLQRGIQAYWGIVLEKIAERVFQRAGYQIDFTGNYVVFPNTGEHIYGVRIPVTQEIYERCKKASGLGEIELSFGCDETGKPYPVSNPEAPMVSDEFFASSTFEKLTGHVSIHHPSQKSGPGHEGIRSP